MKIRCIALVPSLRAEQKNQESTDKSILLNLPFLRVADVFGRGTRAPSPHLYTVIRQEIIETTSIFRNSVAETTAWAPIL